MDLDTISVSWTRKQILVAGFMNGMVVASFGGSDVKPLEKWKDWSAVNDGVMGGLSQSRPVITNRDTLVFTGKVSLENNGGFASIRHDAEDFDLGRGEGILLRVKGDGKKYQLRLRTANSFDGIAYKADFQTIRGEEQEFRFPWSVFSATYRGEAVNNAPGLDPLKIRQVGFLIADKQAGPFELEIMTIKSLLDTSGSRSW